MQQRYAKAVLVMSVWSVLTFIRGFAQQKDVSPVPQPDTTVIDSNGTAHIIRVVPIPDTVSMETQQFIARLQSMPNTAGSQPIAQRRAMVETFMTTAGQEFRKLYPVKSIEEESIGGVPTRIITPVAIPENRRDRVLINLHGGGSVDASSLTETIPIANLTKTKVVAVLYRLLPEHPFPAAVDDVVTVYRELLKTYKPHNIGLYGTSAGAVLSAEVSVKLRKLGLPLPGALGIFSGPGDFSRHGDSEAFFSMTGLSGALTPPSPLDHHATNTEYSGSTDPSDPVLSPIYADLNGFPPTLFITSTRDMFLSGTALLHRAFLHAGVDARLVVFEGLSHAFWVSNPHLPETKEALELMAAFFIKQIGDSHPEAPTKGTGR